MSPEIATKCYDVTITFRMCLTGQLDSLDVVQPLITDEIEAFCQEGTFPTFRAEEVAG